MSYELQLDRQPAKKLQRMPRKNAGQVYARLLSLEHDPRPAGCIKLEDAETSGWRIRIGIYRALYTIDDIEHIVRVWRLDTRDKAYKDRG